ncbi:hypothetical protein MSAN_01984600 [Mycena sanguinolenta]|uniref:Uncharacterized protein n=1 Tax=Mycena sanguinolenta TaxID=230812 RepID=A0A8H6XNK2_9AGAR|nr:hypothetical protein MSAN_01984600 [Mycena sanguinolenta]
MTARRLTETPLFQDVYWSSEPLIDGSFPQIPSDALGLRYSLFLVGMQELDVAACPDPQRIDLDSVEARHELGLPVPPGYPCVMGNLNAQYTIAQARVWLYLVHFKVLDLLLAPIYPRVTLRTFSKSPSVKLGASVDIAIRKLEKWRDSLPNLVALMQPVSAPSVLPQPLIDARDSPAKSVWSILDYAKSGDKSHLATCHRNIQSSATGLIFAPSAYNGAPLDSLGNAAKMLRSLSAILFISPVFALVDVNLQNIHIDFSVQIELNKYLENSSRPVSALPHVERGIFEILRNICAKGVPSDQVISAELPPLLRSTPVACLGDTARFTDLHTTYKPTRSRPVVERPMPPPLTHSAHQPSPLRRMPRSRTDNPYMPRERIITGNVSAEPIARAPFIQPQFSHSDSDDECEAVSESLLSYPEASASPTTSLTQALPSEHRISRPDFVSYPHSIFRSRLTISRPHLKGDGRYRARHVVAVSVVLLAAAVYFWFAAT